MIDPENAQGVQGNWIRFSTYWSSSNYNYPQLKFAINIETTIVLINGYNLPQIESLIQQAIAEYLLNPLRKAWGRLGDDLNPIYFVYIARINSAILSVSGGGECY